MKYFLIESVRRFGQLLVSSQFFSFPIFYAVRKFTYSVIFHIGKNAHIGYNVILHREHKLSNGNIEIGNNVLLADNVKIDYSGGVSLKDNVWLSDSVHIHTHSHKLTKNRINWDKNEIETTHLTIEKNSWLGDGVIVLPSVKNIGENSIIGAGSVITKDIPSNVISGGNPCKLIKTNEVNHLSDEIL